MNTLGQRILRDCCVSAVCLLEAGPVVSPFCQAERRGSAESAQELRIVGKARDALPSVSSMKKFCEMDFEKSFLKAISLV